MFSQILSAISLFILGIISKIGYFGVFFLMALESANIPIPSEIIMPFSGFLVASGRFSFWLLILIGSLGNLFGSWLSYFLAFFAGQPLKQWIKKIPFFEDDYYKAERFFQKHGSASVFWGRLLPIIRTFISFPAGIFRIPFGRFSLLTFSGSFIWSAFLAFIGLELGENWQFIQQYFRKFDYVILIVLVGLVFYYIYSKVAYKKQKNYDEKK